MGFWRMSDECTFIPFAFILAAGGATKSALPIYPQIIEFFVGRGQGGVRGHEPGLFIAETTTTSPQS